MTEWLTGLAALPLAEALRASRWAYPLVNAGHILGLALLVGAVVPMNLALLARGAQMRAAATRLLRPFAAAGLGLAIATGALLFIVQPQEYAPLTLFRLKLALIAFGALNALLHLRTPLATLPAARRRMVALLSLVLWPGVLLCGRLLAYV